MNSDRNQDQSAHVAQDEAGGTQGELAKQEQTHDAGEGEGEGGSGGAPDGPSSAHDASASAASEAASQSDVHQAEGVALLGGGLDAALPPVGDTAATGDVGVQPVAEQVLGVVGADAGVTEQAFSAALTTGTAFVDGAGQVHDAFMVANTDAEAELMREENPGAKVVVADVPAQALGVSSTFGIADIAEVCHEVNRAICLAFGDESQVPWPQAPREIQQSAVKGVQYRLTNPDATPEQQHEAWCRDKMAGGWAWGPVKDAINRTHPCLVPYSALPPDQRVKDHTFQAVVDTLSWHLKPLAEAELIGAGLATNAS